MKTPSALCPCGAPEVGPLGVCPVCEADLREILLPASREGVLSQIAAMASSHPENRALTMIARLAHHGLKLKG